MSARGRKDQPIENYLMWWERDETFGSIMVYHHRPILDFLEYFPFGWLAIHDMADNEMNEHESALIPSCWVVV